MLEDKQIIIDEIEINPNDWLEPYKPIPACEIKDCNHLVYAGNNVYGCRIAEDGLVCDDFNNDDECCMYRQLEYYKEAIKAKKQECEQLKNLFKGVQKSLEVEIEECAKWSQLETETRYALLKKEQECEELRKIIDEAKNSKLDLNSFFAIEATVGEYCLELDQLKAENERLEAHSATLDAVIETGRVQYKALKQTLTEIKEIAENCYDPADKENDGFWTILQKISECGIE